MRYPGPHKHHHTMRWTALAVAVFVFVLGLVAVDLKERKIAAQHRQLRAAQNQMASPLPSPTALTTLVMYDSVTHQPLAGQSIALMSAVACEPGLPCALPSPLVLAADEKGRIMVAQDIIRAKPKLYAAGYKLDVYFSFLSSDKPNELTLYQALPDSKLNYDITAEEVPVSLTPTK